MKGKRKFRNVIAKILENFDVRVVLGNDFSYDPETRTVFFTPFTCSVDDFHRQWISDFFDFTSLFFFRQGGPEAGDAVFVEKAAAVSIVVYVQQPEARL